MSEKRPHTTAEIKGAIIPVSHNYRFMETERRKAEADIHWFVASAGYLYGTITDLHDKVHSSDKSFMTTEKLRGTKRTLNARTLIGAQALTLPVDTTREAIDAFYNSYHYRKEATRTKQNIGYVSLHEPGAAIFKPIKSLASGFIDTDARERELSTKGIDAYLNTERGIHSSKKSPEEIKELIHKTYERLPVYEETMRKALNEIFKR